MDQCIDRNLIEYYVAREEQKDVNEYRVTIFHWNLTFDVNWYSATIDHYRFPEQIYINLEIRSQCWLSDINILMRNTLRPGAS